MFTVVCIIPFQPQAFNIIQNNAVQLLLIISNLINMHSLLSPISYLKIKKKKQQKLKKKLFVFYATYILHSQNINSKNAEQIVMCNSYQLISCFSKTSLNAKVYA